ncbi:unnamed protein product [Ceratitis capitata]|uniref:(Mediterranean fruit fly) hypothetical protein n=1 Tax=Ceratitis capitata TaxID=7213 RepID=A0A811V8Q0_CERCA|nr:unnamed protein product [Ceratitis capitata]
MALKSLVEAVLIASCLLCPLSRGSCRTSSGAPNDDIDNTTIGAFTFCSNGYMRRHQIDDYLFTAESNRPLAQFTVAHSHRPSR